MIDRIAQRAPALVLAFVATLVTFAGIDDLATREQGAAPVQRVVVVGQRLPA